MTIVESPQLGIEEKTGLTHVEDFLYNYFSKNYGRRLLIEDLVVNGMLSRCEGAYDSECRVYIHYLRSKLLSLDPSHQIYGVVGYRRYLYFDRMQIGEVIQPLDIDTDGLKPEIIPLFVHANSLKVKNEVRAMPVLTKNELNIADILCRMYPNTVSYPNLFEGAGEKEGLYKFNAAIVKQHVNQIKSRTEEFRSQEGLSYGIVTVRGVGVRLVADSKSVK